MITLQEAITLAREAHKGQWRKPTNLLAEDAFNRLHEEGVANLIKFGVIETSEYKITATKESNSYSLLLYEPYITHPLAVMDMMSTEEEKIVAVLHDIIEDTEAFTAICDEQGHILVYNKKSYGIPSKAYEVLKLLTHNKSLSYDKYVKYISYNKLATKVKIADIVHNLSCSPSDHSKQKYLKAIPVLLKSI